MNLIKNNYYKIIVTAFLLLLAFLSLSKTFDNYGEKYTNEGFQRSLAAFGIAKGLNSAISFAQGTEVALEPAGVGVILTPGQILDPVNDLIERFSWVMLICTTSLGIQSILLTIFSSSYFATAVTVALFIACLIVWSEQIKSVEFKNILYRVAVFLIILRFFIPLMAITSDGLYKAFLKSKHDESTLQLEHSDEAITKLSKGEAVQRKAEKETSLYESLKQNINAAIDAFDVDKRIEQLKTEAEIITNYIIDLIIVFTMQTILFPLIFIWLSIRLVRASFSFRFI